jgi:hypothetical protein
MILKAVKIMGFLDFFKGKTKAETEVDELREKLMNEVFPDGRLISG